MNEPQTFRTQLSGFHRGDVAEYIQRTAREHQQELRRLQDELTREREEKETLRQQLASMQGQPQAVPQPTPVPEVSESMELAAYRRAEAAERSAMQRIRKQTEKLEQLMARVQRAYTDAGTELGELTASVKNDTRRMQEIFAGLNGELESSKAAMETLREEAEA